MRSPFLYLVPAALLLLAGCTTPLRFAVDAINNPSQPMGRSYVILPGDPDVAVNDLRFQEAARYAEAALAGPGFFRVGDPEQADMVITLDAAVGEPQSVTRSESRPMYIETGGYYRQVTRPVRGRDGQITYVTSTIWSPPRNHYVGSYEATDTVLVYEKRFSLTAFSNGAGQVERLPQLWSVVVLNRDTNSDMRQYLPLMAAVASDYIDSNTGRQVVVSMKADDPRVQVLRESVSGSPRSEG